MAEKSEDKHKTKHFNLAKNYQWHYIKNINPNSNKYLIADFRSFRSIIIASNENGIFNQQHEERKAEKWFEAPKFHHMCSCALPRGYQKLAITLIQSHCYEKDARWQWQWFWQRITIFLSAHRETYAGYLYVISAQKETSMSSFPKPQRRFWLK